MVADGEGNQSKSGVGDAGHPSVSNKRDTGSAFEIDNEFRSARHLVVLVVAHGFRFDGVVVQQLLSLASVFAGNDIGFFEDAERAERDVLEIADRRADEVETGRESEGSSAVGAPGDMGGSLHRAFFTFCEAGSCRSYKSQTPH